MFVNDSMLELRELSHTQKISVLAQRWLNYPRQLRVVNNVTWPFQHRYMGIFSQIYDVFSRLTMPVDHFLMYCRNMEDVCETAAALLDVDFFFQDGYEEERKSWNDFCEWVRAREMEVRVPRFLWPMVVKAVEAVVVVVPVVVLRRSQRVSRVPARYM